MLYCINEFLYSNFTRQVTKNEGDFVHMFSIENIIPCMAKLKNTNCIVLKYETIEKCDEEQVKVIGTSFMRKYHHFTYPSSGVVNCKYVKGEGDYTTHRMKKVGMN